MTPMPVSGEAARGPSVPSLSALCADYVRASGAPAKDAAARSLRYAMETSRSTVDGRAPVLCALREAWGADSQAQEPLCVGWLFEGIELVRRGLGDRALKALSRVRDACQSWTDNAGTAGLLEAHALRGLALLECERGQIDEALALLDRGEALAQELALPTLGADLLHVRGVALRRSGQTEEALAALEEALQRYRFASDMLGVARVQDTIGMVFMDKGELQESQFRFQLSLSHKTAAGDLPGVAITLGNLGRVYRQMEDFPKAAELFEQDREVSRELGDMTGELIALHELLHALIGLGKPAEAGEVLGQAKRLVGRLAGDPKAAANHDFAAAELHLARGEIEAAAERHALCREALGDAATPFERALLHRQQGDLHTARQDYGQALAEYGRAAELAEPGKRRSFLADVQFRAGMVLARRGRLAESAPYLSRAIGLAYELQAQRMRDRFAAECDRIGSEAWLEALLEAKRLNEQLREAHAMQEALAAQVVHDLRNPVHCLDMALAMAQQSDEARDDPAAAEVIRRGRAQCAWLTELISSLLDISKMEQGALQAKRETVLLAALLREVADWFELEAADAQMSVRVDFDDASLAPRGDTELVRRMLVNLTKNALKYGQREGGEIVLGAESLEEGRQVRVYVRDPGEGIPLELQGRIFEKFGQLQATVRKHSSGIGLYFCKLAAEAQGGRIGVESEVGKGSTFWFTLPTA